MAYVRGPTRGQKRALEEKGESSSSPPSSSASSYHLQLERLGKALIIKGDTYDLRATMRENGGEWNGTNKWWMFVKPSTSLLSFLKIDKFPEKEEGVMKVTVSEEGDSNNSENSKKEEEHVAMMCSNGKTLIVAKSYKTGGKCHTCKGGIKKSALMLGMNRIKTISRGAGYFGDGSSAWSKAVNWTDWSHLECFVIPKIMYRELGDRYELLGGWELGVEGVGKLTDEQRELLSEKCPPSREKIVKIFESLKTNCPKLPVTLNVLVTEYVFPMDFDLVSELSTSERPPSPIDFAKFTVAQLKTELKARKMDTTGVKKVLLERLLAA